MEKNDIKLRLKDQNLVEIKKGESMKIKLK